MPHSFVVRQLSGGKLYHNLTGPLPVRVFGGRLRDIPQTRRASLDAQRDPAPHNGLARELFASDLLAARSGELAHDYEEQEKELLRIGERLGLRGAELDAYHQAALASARNDALVGALDEIRDMTLTVIDGDFSREVMASENITFATYKMARFRNHPSHYDAKQFGPAPERDGLLYETGSLGPDAVRDLFAPMMGALLLGFVAFGWGRRRGSDTAFPRASRIFGVIVLATLVAGLAVTAVELSAKDRASLWIEHLGHPEDVDAAVAALVSMGEEAVEPLLARAAEDGDLAGRGWALVSLGAIGGDGVTAGLADIYEDRSQPALVRTWAAAARVGLARDTDELAGIAYLVNELPPLGRPIGERVLALETTGGHNSVEDMILLSLRVPGVQRTLAAPILAAPPQALAETMLSAGDTNVRRMAAGYLATSAAQGDGSVADVVIDALRFDNGARAVPWEGGALFLPSIDWSQREARALCENLIKWLVFCDARGLTNEARPIHNNLYSVGLTRTAGIAFPRERTVDGWLEVWGNAFGQRAVDTILGEQGMKR